MLATTLEETQRRAAERRATAELLLEQARVLEEHSEIEGKAARDAIDRARECAETLARISAERAACAARLTQLVQDEEAARTANDDAVRILHERRTAYERIVSELDEIEQRGSVEACGALGDEALRRVAERRAADSARRSAQA